MNKNIPTHQTKNMKKDFKTWITLKQNIHHNGLCKFYHEREVWWCSLGVNVGFEQDGGGLEKQRPVLILKGLSRHTCLVVPLTSSAHTHQYRIPMGVFQGEKASAIISQIRVVDTKRLVEKIDYIDKTLFEIIRKAARDML